MCVCVCIYIYIINIKNSRSNFHVHNFIYNYKTFIKHMIRDNHFDGKIYKVHNNNIYNYERYLE